jgi:hypothetical protein
MRGHGAARLGKGDAVGGKDLGEEIDVAAQIQHVVVIARQHRLLGLLADRPPVEIGALVGAPTSRFSGFIRLMQNWLM